MKMFLKPKKVIATLSLISLSSILLSQTPDTLSQADINEIARITKSTNTLITILGVIGGAVIAFITALITTNRKIKSTVDKHIEEKSAEFVDNFFSERLHVKPEIVHQLFQEYQAEREQMAAQRIFVVFKSGVDKKDLITYLQNKGFVNATGITIGQPVEGIKTNDVLLFYAADSNPVNCLSDEEIDKYAKNYHTDARLIYYGPSRYQGEHNMSNYANSKATLINRLKDML